MDWQKEKDYAYVHQLSFAQWAWEFLRRNPQFRRDFKSIDEVGHGTRLMSQWGLNSIPDDIDQVGNPLWRKEAAKHHVVTVLNDDQTPKDLKRDGYQNVVFFSFDLSSPMEEQFEQLANLIDRLREYHGLVPRGETRTAQRLWPIYIRVLDARASGATYKEIGEFFFRDFSSPEEKARETIRQAKKKTEPQGYMPILRLAEGRRTKGK